MKHFKGFTDWLAKRINEVGTGTNSVAVFAVPVTAPIRRKKPKNIILPEQFNTLTNLGKYNNIIDPNQTIPVENIPVPSRAEFSVKEYRGTYPGIFAKVLEYYNKTKNKSAELALISSVNGNDENLIDLYRKKF